MEGLESNKRKSDEHAHSSYLGKNERTFYTTFQFALSGRVVSHQSDFQGARHRKKVHSFKFFVDKFFLKKKEKSRTSKTSN
jgi:hypothetical protein